MKKTRLKNFPVSMFSIIMGLTGFAIALQKVDELSSVAGMASMGALGLSSLFFVILLVTYVAKIIRHPLAIKAEFLHPIKRNFMPTVAISFLLQSIAYLPHSPTLSSYLWFIGVVVQLGLSLAVIGSWIWRDGVKPEHLNPAWFIPAVGNMLVPIAGVPLGFIDISWFFFSVGFLFWIILMSAFMYRSFFHEQLPAKLQPTLFILIAPPAIITISLSKLTIESVELLHMSYSVGIFFLLLLLTQIHHFARLPFYISWWAYSFPLAALTIASIVMYRQTGEGIYSVIGWSLLAALTVLIGILLVKTISAVMSKRICVEE